MSRGILDLEKSGPSKDQVSKLLRFAHTLKGAARVVKQIEISQNSHSIEDILAPYREGTKAIEAANVKQVLTLMIPSMLNLKICKLRSKINRASIDSTS